MYKSIFISITALTCCLMMFVSAAQNSISRKVIVCPSISKSDSPPSFTDQSCEESSFYRANPRNRQIWIKATLNIDALHPFNQDPLGIFLAGKASSHLYLNGKLIAQNGTPSTDKESEVIGKMDFIAFASPLILKQGENELLIKMSSHHGFLDLAAPLHNLSIGTYLAPSLSILKHYWRSLIPLGILLLGAAYFWVLGVKQKQPWAYFLLPSMALFSAGQLATEVMRAFYIYPYPIHDLRLILILVMALGFGLSLLGYVLYILKLNYGRISFALITTLTIAMILLTQGFDYKSAIALGLPSLASLLICGYCVFKKKTQAPVLVFGLAVFMGALVSAPGDFLDIYFFYVVAAFVFFLFIQQLKALANDQREKAQEKARADKLQLIIDQNQLINEHMTLSIKSAGKTELVKVSNIAYCKGAGDYVELVLKEGNTVLHSETLSELEKSLPSPFLRVHRSYIVNTSLIERVERKKTGVGSLYLSGIGSVPVSRRIMPSVREQIEAITD